MADTHTDTPNDRKKRSPIVDVPRGKLPTGLHHLELMSTSVSVETLALAKEWYTTLRFSKLQSEAEFTHAWDCWKACTDLQGTIKEYRDQLNVQASGLKTRYQQWRSEQEAWFTSDVQSTWAEVCSILKEHLSPEIWKNVGARMEALFSGKPPESGK